MNLHDINAKYAEICQQIGDAHFQIKQFEAFINKKLLEAQELNKLAGMLKNKSNTSETNEA